MSFLEDINRAGWKFANAACGADTRPKMFRLLFVVALGSVASVVFVQRLGAQEWSQVAAAFMPLLPWPPLYLWGAWQAILKRDKDQQMRLDYLKAPESGLWAGEDRVMVTDLRQAYARARVLSDVITKVRNDYQSASEARDAWRATPLEPLGPDANADQRYGWGQASKRRREAERRWKDQMVGIAHYIAAYRATPDQAFSGPPHEADPAFEQACRELHQEVHDLDRLLKFHAEKKRA